jgi:hypothetical protein
MGATCSRHAFRSHHIAGLLEVARGRSDLHGRPKRMKAPEYCKIGAGRTEYSKIGAGRTQRQGLFRQNGVSRLAATARSGIRERIDGIGWSRANLCIDTRDPRDDVRDRQAPTLCQESEGGISEASSEAAGRLERTALISGHGTSATRPCRHRRTGNCDAYEVGI